MSTTKNNSMFFFESATPTAGTIVVIEKQTLIRECLSQCLANETGCPIAAFPDIESWQEVSHHNHPLLFVVSIIGIPKNDARVDQVVRRLESSKGAPIVILSDTDDLKEVTESLKHGVRGHIPTATGLDVAVKAIQLILAGGVYASASHFWTARRSFPLLVDFGEKQETFTQRQFAVLDAVRHGKANKVIARELNISENTVKVHLRHVMRKLGAKNRMEAAILAS